MKIHKLLTLDVTGGTLGIDPKTLDEIIAVALRVGLGADKLDETITVESVTEVGTSDR